MPYVGGKQGMADMIIGLIDPDNRHYIEPFAGGLGVLLAKAPSPMETVNDADERIVTFWRVLRDRPDELIHACSLTPHSRAEFATARIPADDDVEQARRTWVQLSQGRGSRLTRTGWRYVVNNSHGVPAYLDGYLDRMSDVAARLRRVSLECGDGVDIIRAYDDPGTTFYVDPPYLAETRGRSTLYRVEMGDEERHERLLEALLACKGQVILSGYASDLYDSALADWERHTHSLRDQTATTRTEVVWVNRTGHAQLDFQEPA